MACSICGGGGHNSRTCVCAPDCIGCGEQIRERPLEVNGKIWHEGCFEVGGGPRYCCGALYGEGEDVCASCGDPL